VPDLGRLIPELEELVSRLEAAEANQYRLYRFDGTGGIRACFAFVRIDAELAAVPAEVLALGQAVQAILLWSDRAFTDRSALVQTAGGATILRPEVANVIRAAYDPVMPPAAGDAAHAIRLAARLPRPFQG